MAMPCYVFCRVPSTLRPLLSNASAPKDELYSEEQMRGVLSVYAAANALEMGDGSIKLDKLMISNLFNKKEPQLEGDLCAVEDVVRRLLGKLQLFHKVTRVAEQVGLSEDCIVEVAMLSLCTGAGSVGRLSWYLLRLFVVRLFAAHDRNINADRTVVCFLLPAWDAVLLHSLWR